MKIIYVDPLEFKDMELKKGILNLLDECSDEFVPSLSSRNSTKQTDFKNNKNEIINTKPLAYFNMIIKQNNILTIDNNKVIAIMSFIHNYGDNEYFGTDIKYKINNYISTVCVKKEYRHQNIASKLYDFIENQLPQNLKGDFISTRTWSSNKSHINLLKKRGYKNTYTIKNDRILSDSTMVDTMYFCKKFYKNEEKTL